MATAVFITLVVISFCAKRFVFLSDVFRELSIVYGLGRVRSLTVVAVVALQFEFFIIIAVGHAVTRRISVKPTASKRQK